MAELPLRVILLGCGTVGSEVARALSDPDRAARLADAAGGPLEVVGIAVADPSRERPGMPAHLLTGDAATLVRDTHADIVIELIGGVDGTVPLIEASFESGASVITANKALLSTHLRRLSSMASDRGLDLYYEAAVAGAIPIVRALRTSLSGQRLHRVMGIVNGTTNFVLTTMTKDRADYADVLAKAQELGYAESDPTADVGGHDAAQKAAILATLAFGQEVTDADVPREGIEKVTAADLDAAARAGHVVRLLAIAERVGDGAVSVRVHPAMVPVGHPLAAVDGALNAVFVEGADPGPLMFLGTGAGGTPTASAVLGDLIAAARNRRAGTSQRPPTFDDHLELLPLERLVSAFYLAVEVADRPGVLASVATVFGEHGVSIRSMEQVGLGSDARLVFLTHEASEAAMAATVEDLSELEAVEEIGVLLRIVDGSDS